VNSDSHYSPFAFNGLPGAGQENTKSELKFTFSRRQGRRWQDTGRASGALAAAVQSETGNTVALKKRENAVFLLKNRIKRLCLRFTALPVLL
jgi:hypothetical protein